MITTYQIWDLIIKVVGFGATAIGVIVAAVTYRKNSRLEQAKWLTQLYEKFFEGESYREIRMLLDYNSSPSEKYIRLEDVVKRKSDTEQVLQESLVIYLNFFEYIATLWKTKQIDRKDVHMMFGYYVKIFEKHPWVIAFAKDNEFKNLPAMISVVRDLENQK